jgi:hypothetical protein
MTTFSDNKLPLPSQPWGREVTKAITSLESKVESERINNTARDNQLNSSIIANQAATVKAQNAAQNAQDAIDAITGLSTPGSGTTVNASNIIGGTLKTATSGRHTEITSTQINFFDGSGNYSGRISAADDGRASTVEIETTSATGFIAYNGGVDLNGPGSTISAGNNGNGNILLSSSGGVEVSSNLDVSGYVSASGSISTSSNLSVSSGIYGYSGASITGTVTAGGLSVGGSSATTGITNTGGITSTGTIATDGGLRRTAYSGGGTTGASVDNNGTFIRTSSSARYKQDIQDADYAYEAVLGLQPKSFRLKNEAAEDENAIFYPGFVAEELAGTDLDIFVSYETLPDGTKRPDGVRYAELTSALVSALKHQNGLIQSLTARIETLESKV